MALIKKLQELIGKSKNTDESIEDYTKRLLKSNWAQIESLK